MNKPGFNKNFKFRNGKIVIKEQRLHKNAVAWFDMQYPRLRQLLFHIPNGGSRNVIEAVEFKKMGVRRGVADMFLTIPGGQFHGLYLELKMEGQYQTDDQKLFQSAVQQLGYKYQVVKTVEAFVDAVQEYLSHTPFYKPSWKDAQGAKKA